MDQIKSMRLFHFSEELLIVNRPAAVELRG